MNRAQRRKLGLKKKPDLDKKVGLFDKLPKQCTNCDKPYDKNSKEMAMTWRVVVNEEQKRVTLICPDCQAKVAEGIEKVFGGNDDEAGV